MKFLVRKILEMILRALNATSKILTELVTNTEFNIDLITIKQ
jgi:hypothetical protein